MEITFYRCSICGQIVQVINKTGSQLVCCGKPMEELIPCSADASFEKHVPEITTKRNKVHITVGSAPHPMSKEHFIEWICLETKDSAQLKMLKSDDDPEACFCICDDDDVTAVYAYCNLHGLWKKMT